MRVVTFVSKYDGLTIVQEDGKKKGARLWAVGAGLKIYLVGQAKGTSHDTLTNLGCNLAQSMNIPLTSFRYAAKGEK